MLKTFGKLIGAAVKATKEGYREGLNNGLDLSKIKEFMDKPVTEHYKDARARIQELSKKVRQARTKNKANDLASQLIAHVISKGIEMGKTEDEIKEDLVTLARILSSDPLNVLPIEDKDRE
jgi:DNA-binding transcriptional MerR regulator